MRQYCFSNDAYGDTEILEENGELHLIQLFGLEMEVRDFQPPRVVGLQDVYTSLGDCAFSQKVKSVVQTKDQIEIVLDLYGGKMKYVIHMEHIPQLGIIRRKDTLLNLSDKCIYLMKVKQRFNFSDDKYEVFFQKSEWGTENCGAWYPLTPAGVTLGCICGRTCESHTPMLAIQNRYGHGVCVHLIPKGNWEMNMRLHSRQNVGQEYQYLLETGDSSEHFYYPLEAGATYEAPELWLMSMSKGLLGMQANLQRYFLQIDTERMRMQTHPLVYNSWLDRRDRFDLEHIRKTVVSAKELGVEVFVVDAGWFGNCEYDPNMGGEDWYQQVGDWSEKKNNAFYGDVTSFADFVRSCGMKFGMWIEPERFGMRTPVVLTHPEYFAQGHNFLFPRLWLPEVRGYIYQMLDEFISKYDLDWIKIDFNFELEEDPSGCGLHTYYDNWYGILEELREKHPKCAFEGCASGGLRTDIRDVLHYDACFQSDNGNDVDTERFFEQLSLRIPAYKCQKWLALRPGGKIFDFKNRCFVDSVSVPWHGGDMSYMSESRSLEFVSMLHISSNMALSGNFTDLSVEQREIIKMYIRLWKKYRDFYKRSILLLGREPGIACNHSGMQHLQYLEENTGKGLVFVYKFDSPRSEYLLHLRELDENAIYRLTDAVSDELLGEYMGKTLMLRGIRVELFSRSFFARMIDIKKL